MYNYGKRSRDAMMLFLCFYTQIIPINLRLIYVTYLFKMPVFGTYTRVLSRECHRSIDASTVGCSKLGPMPNVYLHS